MKRLKFIDLAGGVLLLALNVPAHAQQVQMYDKPVSAEEMGRILFGNKSEDTPAATSAPSGIKTRAISFKPKAAPEVKSETAVVQSAKAELASIGLPIQFAYNSDEILPESIPFLDEIGKMLTLDDFSSKRLVIEGHTDAAGSDMYNMSLSQRRAKAVSRYLVNNFSISSARLKALGLGESKPLPGYDPEDEANRRVQFYSAN